MYMSAFLLKWRKTKHVHVHEVRQTKTHRDTHVYTHRHRHTLKQMGKRVRAGGNEQECSCILMPSAGMKPEVKPSGASDRGDFGKVHTERERVGGRARERDITPLASPQPQHRCKTMLSAKTVGPKTREYLLAFQKTREHLSKTNPGRVAHMRCCCASFWEFSCPGLVYEKAAPAWSPDNIATSEGTLHFMSNGD